LEIVLLRLLRHITRLSWGWEALMSRELLWSSWLLESIIALHSWRLLEALGRRLARETTEALDKIILLELSAYLEIVYVLEKLCQIIR
jgi:hypothetical protein